MGSCSCIAVSQGIMLLRTDQKSCTSCVHDTAVCMELTSTVRTLAFAPLHPCPAHRSFSNFFISAGVLSQRHFNSRTPLPALTACRPLLVAFGAPSVLDLLEHDLGGSSDDLTGCNTRRDMTVFFPEKWLNLTVADATACPATATSLNLYTLGPSIDSELQKKKCTINQQSSSSRHA